MVTETGERRPVPLCILSCWHNAFDDIIGSKPDELGASITAAFGAATLDGEPLSDERLEPSVAKILASVGQANFAHRRRAGRQDSGRIGLVGLLAADETMHVDVLKVPHHGSAHNMEQAFFERVTTNHYVFSGNGEYGNPARRTLEMLFTARGQHGFVLHFTYPVDEINAKRAKVWEEERQRGRRDRNWVAADDSLTALFASRNLAAA